MEDQVAKQREYLALVASGKTQEASRLKEKIKEPKVLFVHLSLTREVYEIYKTIRTKVYFEKPIMDIRMADDGANILVNWSLTSHHDGTTPLVSVSEFKSHMLETYGTGYEIQHPAESFNCLKGQGWNKKEFHPFDCDCEYTEQMKEHLEWKAKNNLMY